MLTANVTVILNTIQFKKKTLRPLHIVRLEGQEVMPRTAGTPRAQKAEVCRGRPMLTTLLRRKGAMHILTPHASLVFLFD